MAILTGGPLGGINLRGAIALDSDVTAFFAAMDAANEPYWPSEKTMVSNFVTALKAPFSGNPLGVWPLISLLWLPVGGLLAGSMRALKHPSGIATAMTNTGFVSDKWNRLVGLDSRDGGGFINTLTSGSTYFVTGETSQHICVVSEQINLSWNAFSFDIGTDVHDSTRFATRYGGGGGNGVDPTGGSIGNILFRPYGAGGSAGLNFVPGVPVVGSYVGSQTGETISLWRNGNLLATETGKPAGSTPGTAPVFIFKSGVLSYKTLSLASIGKGLSGAQYLVYHDAIQAARTARAALTPP